MKKLKRAAALLLCLTMLIPTHIVSASSLIPEETLHIEEGEEEERNQREEIASEDWSEENKEEKPIEMDQESDQTEESSHYQETVQLKPVNPSEFTEWDGNLVIYWNPDDRNIMMDEWQTASQSQVAGFAAGSDHADGLTPASAVRSLNAAIRRAEKLSRQQEVEVFDITIKAMSPMLIPQDMMYTVRGRGVHITSWEGRSDDSDLIFVVDGGQLTLHNLILEPHDLATEPDDAELIYIKAGTVQLGEKVEAYGEFILDYQSTYEEISWSSFSEAEASDSDANQYSEPLVELLKRFEPASDYILDLRVPDDRESVTAVQALFSDSMATDEFMEAFALAENNTEDWKLFVEERIGGVLRDTTEEEGAEATASEGTSDDIQTAHNAVQKNEDTALTQKSLVATRGSLRSEGEIVYWNPGDAIEFDGEVYPAGDDVHFDGTRDTAPVRSWWKARELAKGGTIICMQTIDLSTAGLDTMMFKKEDIENGISAEYLDADGNFVLDGERNNRVTLTNWSKRGVPILLIPDDTSVVIKNISLLGKSGLTLLAEGGQIILEDNVVTGEGAYIQVNLDYDNQAKDHPIIVNHTNVEATVYFGGINENIGWRYQDVIVSGENLLNQVGNDRDAAGDVLLQNIHLHEANANNNLAYFKWSLRKDLGQDLGGQEDPSRLELYTEYYYDAVFIDGERGSDTNLGASCQYPVQSFTKAHELLLKEMTISLAARQEAFNSGRDWTVYDIPSVLYICGTITVEDIEKWELPTFTDVDGTLIEIEFQSHMEPAQRNGADIHEIPEILVHVKGSQAELTLGTGLKLKNYVNKNEKDTYSIVIDEGATLKFEANAELTGLTNQSDRETRTLGTHLLVGMEPQSGTVTSGHVEMETSWTGSIHSKQYGVRAYGNTSEITMNAGEISNHYNKFTTYNSNQYQAGVYVKGASFTMNGGRIAQNSSNLGGAGVYVDQGGTFNLVKGSVEQNKVLLLNNMGTKINVLAYGAGVYVASGGTFSMGEEQSPDHDAAKIADNVINSQFEGVGVYIQTNASFHMYSGTISGNKGMGTGENYSYNYLSRGGGISNYGDLTITGGIIENNGASFDSSRPHILGGGIYLGGTNQSISDAIISNNQTGGYYNSGYWGANMTGGGGIYTTRSLKLEKTVFEGNRAHNGGGLVAYFNSTTYLLEMDECEFKDNLATIQNAAAIPGANVTAWGNGGAAYIINAKIEATKLTVTGNKAQSAGGFYLTGTNYPSSIDQSVFCENIAAGGTGGGIYNYVQLSLTNSEVNENRAVTGGAIYNTYLLYMTDVKLKNNTASGEGGGLYNGSTCLLLRTEIEGNTSGSLGGGIRNSSGLTITDSKIINNKANQKGGGIYNYSTLHLGEWTAGETIISGNEANLGGGIYQESGLTNLNTSTPMVNKVVGDGAQGNNIYLTQVNTSASQFNILGGKMEQPADTAEGVYNIYMNSTGSTYARMYLDPQVVRVGGDHPIFLNSTNNYLVFYRNPLAYDDSTPEGAALRLPVDLNIEKFTFGSPVVKPANVNSASMNLAKENGAILSNFTQATTYYTTSPYYRDAATTQGIAYISGGIQPYRTELGRYKDTSNQSLINIVLIGKGVYLDGIEGKDVSDNDGPVRDGKTPETAVKTFDKAKELLEQYTNDANGSVSYQDGFAPFIYICGTVTVSQNETWEIDYNDPIYQEDSKYWEWEISQGREPELAQIKRFTSYLKQPLVKVSGAQTTLTIPKLIFNGMADSVITAEQATDSRLFDVKDANLVLLDKTVIRNNYRNVIRVDHGSLKISSNTEDSADFKNQQVEMSYGNSNGIEILNDSTMEMSGYATIEIPYRPTTSRSIENYASSDNHVTRGVMVSGSSSLTIKDDSKIVFTEDAVLPGASYAVGVVIGNTTSSNNPLVPSPKKSAITMTGNAQISNCHAGIALLDFDTDILLTDQAVLKDNYFGIYSYNKVRSGVTIELDKDAKIFNSYERGATKVMYHGIYLYNTAALYRADALVNVSLKGNSSISDAYQYGALFTYLRPMVNFTMEDNASISNAMYGVYHSNAYGMINFGMSGNSIVKKNSNYGFGVTNHLETTTLSFTMTDSSAIEGSNTGVYVTNNYGITVFNLLRNSKIQSNSAYGIYLGSAREHTTINLDGTDGDQDGGARLIDNATSGIYVATSMEQVNINLRDNSSISKSSVTSNNYGIYLNSTQKSVNINLSGNSKISKYQYGICTAYGYNEPVTVNMSDTSSITDSSVAGIYMFYGIKDLHINMSGNAWIGATANGSSAYGIYLYSLSSNGINGEKNDNYIINMTGNAMIGGDAPANGVGAKRGHTSSGIYSMFPVTINMDTNSKISCNNLYGIYLSCYSTSTAYMKYYYGETKINLRDTSSIDNSQYGIYGAVKTDGQYEIKDTISLSDNASITNTLNGNKLLANTSFSMHDNAKIAEPTTANETAYKMELNGDLNLHGTATLEGILYLKNGQKPITLSKPVPAGEPVGKYRLHLVEGYVGEIVVKPDGTEVTNADLYYDYFVKVLGDGMAGSRDLVKASPNIILVGENNVYLSNIGSDDNNGTTPTTAVRTFKKAKEILKNGYFTEGANILICYNNGTTTAGNYPIQVLAGDEEWSFDTGGYITNQNTNETWRPMVRRDKNYFGTLIQLSQGVNLGVGKTGAGYLNLKDIIIDGAGDFELVFKNRSYYKELIKVTNGTVTLNQNAFLQNNRTDMQNSYMGNAAEYSALGVYIEAGGTFIMAGGTIQNLGIENYRNIYSQPIGLAVYNLGHLEILDGLIQTNSVSLVSNYVYGFSAGAIVNNGASTFAMKGGTVSNNTFNPANQSDTYMTGGGVVLMGAAKGTIKGGLISENKGGAGAGIYYTGTGSLELEGGRVRGNLPINREPVALNSPIFIGAPSFNLKGGGSVLDDTIYLNAIQNSISLSGSIYQASRKYSVYLNQGSGATQFKKGSIVVKPDGNLLSDASQYLINFDIRANPYVADRGYSKTKIVAGNANVTESNCLLLMQAVFIDSDKGVDGNGGSSPHDAVSSFARAKAIGQQGSDPETKDYFIIYISGAVKPNDGENWDLAEIAYMCRYTGFTIYKADGKPIDKATNTYHNFMIEPQGKLELDHIRILGRRVIDSEEKNGDSILHIKSGSQVTINKNTSLSRNYNAGNYIGEDGQITPLGAKGGAVLVEPGGYLLANGGTISEVSTSVNTAIYQKAEKGTGGTEFGRVKLDHMPYVVGVNNSPCIEGGIYLEGQIDGAEAYIEVTDQYIPRLSNNRNGTLAVRLENDYSGRAIISYDGVVPNALQVEYYQLEDSIIAIYDLLNRAGEENVLELNLRSIIYVDPNGGNNSFSGTTPETAVKNLKGVYTRVKEMGESSGTMVFVINTIDISGNYTLVNEKYKVGGQMHYRGKYIEFNNAGLKVDEVAIDSQLYFKRYVEPPATTALGYDVRTNLKELFHIKNGAIFTINGIFIDGHSETSISVFDYLNAPGTSAEAPLITVDPGGYLDAGSSTTSDVSGDLTIETLLSNNTNINKKNKELGQDDKGDTIYEGSSAGIEILSDATDNGEVILTQVVFKNLSLGEQVDGGTDIYQNGHLKALQQTMFTGTVFLEGMGASGNTDSSRYLEVLKYGTPFKENFKLNIRDPYNTRKVVVFPSNVPDGPPNPDLGYFLLEEKVNKHYALSKRAIPNRHILELTIPKAVYLDSINGDDINYLGYVPAEPVQTLKRAYEKLRESGGKVIYIMNPVEINESLDLSAGKYLTSGAEVNLLVTTDHVDIRRFVRPKAGDQQLAGTEYNELFDKPDYLGTLFKVKNGAILTLKNGVNIDGHHFEKIEQEFTSEFYVDRKIDVISPLIEVESGGTLKLQDGATLRDNHNVKELSGAETRVHGGAIFNSGTVELSGGKIVDNEALKGAGVYQDGTFEILNTPSGIEGQEIYLTTVKTGSLLNPVWGADRILHIAVWLENDFKLDLNMDHPVPGRPVVRYTSHTGVDSQWVNYTLDSLIPENLFLVEDEEDDTVLELQDWRVLDISVPEEIFLVIQRTATGTVQAREAKSDDLMMASPMYTIKNNGIYDAKVSLSGFVNQNTEAGITDYDVMNLVASPADAISDNAGMKDLYLAIRGTDQNDGFSAMPETSLYDFSVDGVKKQEMGILESGSEAQFEFVAAASRRFMNYYADAEFPIMGAGATKENRIAHIRHKDLVTEVTSANRARAKYKMLYRLEIVPIRRN